MNQVMLSGRLTRDPELRQTMSGKKVCSFCLAVQDTKERADFINCSAWEKTADTIATYFKKGDPIIVFGKMTVSKWEKDGKPQTSVEVTVRQIEFPMSKKTEEKYTDPSEAFRAAAEEEGELPY